MMPKYTFTSPSGKKFKVTAPEGATPQQAMAYLIENNADFKAETLKQAAASTVNNPLRSAKLSDAKVEEFKALPESKKTAINIGAGVKKAARGVRQLLNADNVTPEELIKEGNAVKQLSEAQGRYAGPIAQAVGTTLATAPVMALGAPSSVLATGLLQGAAQGAVEPSYNPTWDYGDKAQNAAMGGMLGVGTAGALKGAGWLGQKGYEAVRGAAPAFSKSAARSAAGRTAVEELGADRVPTIVQALRGVEEYTPIGTRQTAATGTGDLGLAALERASRSDRFTSGGWNKLDFQNNDARAAYLRRHLGDMTGNVAQARTMREEATAPIRDAALEAINKNSDNLGTEVLSRMRDVRVGDRDAARLVDDIRSALRKNPDGTTLYSLRKSLTDSGMADNAAIREVIEHIDTAMAGRGGQLWNRYLNQYSAMSDPVNNAEAMQAIGGQFFDPNTGGAVGPTMGMSPRVSGDTVANLLKTKGFDPEFGPRISPGNQKALQDLIDEERLATLSRDVVSSNAVERGGEHGMGDALMQAAAAKTGVPGWWGASMVGRVTGQKNRAQAMAELLRNPQAMAQVMEQVTAPTMSGVYGGDLETLGRNVLTEYLRGR